MQEWIKHNDYNRLASVSRSKANRWRQAGHVREYARRRGVETAVRARVVGALVRVVGIVPCRWIDGPLHKYRNRGHGGTSAGAICIDTPTQLYAKNP